MENESVVQPELVEVKPEEVKPEEVKPEEVKPEEVKPEEVKPEILPEVVTESLSTDELFVLITNIPKIEKLIQKYSISLPSKTLERIVNILKVLEQNKSLKPIIEVITNVFADGKLEPHEIPLLVKVLAENILSIKSIKISSDDLSAVLKLIILILVEFKVLKINKSDLQMINKVIDYSLDLLHFNIKISKNCFSCFRK
jgi:hypothetical protein